MYSRLTAGANDIVTQHSYLQIIQVVRSAFVRTTTSLAQSKAGAKWLGGATPQLKHQRRGFCLRL